MRPITIIIIVIFFILNSAISQGQLPKREFRGVWIATVNNLDWPSDHNSSIETKKDELLNIINNLEKLNFNAIIFQIRPSADAFYISSTEPCSEYLTGKQGLRPEEDWDPLNFIIDECHKRGMELHAWMNPFRISQNLKKELSDKNVAVRHPEWTVTYDSKLFLDPGIPEVRNYLKDIVSEVVKKYDVDAIHFDDYFYPYPVLNTPFPDTLSFKLYNRDYEDSNINNWRRENVDILVQELSSTIKEIKRELKFGISPFGVWQNYTDHYTGSVTNSGITNYNDLYADVTKWLANGWIDYVMPQIYWEIGHPKADFITLANWWNENSFGKHVYVGHALYKLSDDKSMAWQSEYEMPEQVFISRKLDNVYGSAFFRLKYLDKNSKNFTENLKKEIFKEKALLPQMKWLDSIPPVTPKGIRPFGLFKVKKIKIYYPKNISKPDDFLGYIVYASERKKIDIDNPSNIIQFCTSEEILVQNLNITPKKTFYICVSAIDKHHNESLPVGNLKIRK